jgi:hypothetical protein
LDEKIFEKKFEIAVFSPEYAVNRADSRETHDKYGTTSLGNISPHPVDHNGGGRWEKVEKEDAKTGVERTDFDQFVRFVLTNTLHSAEILFGSECNALYREVTRVLELFDLSSREAVSLKREQTIGPDGEIRSPGTKTNVSRN